MTLGSDSLTSAQLRRMLASRDYDGVIREMARPEAASLNGTRDVFLGLAYFHKEDYPSAVRHLEAAASGLPLIAVRATVMPELVGASGAGVLVEPGDDEAMAEAMLNLLAEPHRAERLGAAARRMAEQHSLEDTLSAHERLYSRLIKAISN